jgi:hypothetical protein
MKSITTIIMMLASTMFVARSAAAFTPRAPTASRAFSRTTIRMAENPKVYFDMEVGGADVGRVTMELRADVAPKTGTFFLPFSTVEWHMYNHMKISGSISVSGCAKQPCY